MKILIVEDEIELAKSMFDYLQNDYSCHLAYDAEEAKEQIALFDYHCILLDIMLPLGSGLQLLKALKTKDKACGVIVISAKNSTEDELASLNLGADAYLPKPFHLAALSAKIQSVIRDKNAQPSGLLSFKDLTLNLQLKQVRVAGADIEVSKTEFSLLLFLLLNKNKVVSKNAIAENLSQKVALYFDNFDIIHSHIKSLKHKLGPAGLYINSVYSSGYKLS